MRFIMALLILATALAAPARASTYSPGEAIQKVISSQIMAFRADDAETAYSYAAPGIQELFPTPEIFMEMVQSGYRPVYRPQAFSFGPLSRKDGQWVQPVSLMAADGVPAMALYLMEQMPGGDWKIAGVYMLLGTDRAI